MAEAELEFVTGSAELFTLSEQEDIALKIKSMSESFVKRIEASRLG